MRDRSGLYFALIVISCLVFVAAVTHDVIDAPVQHEVQVVRFRTLLVDSDGTSIPVIFEMSQDDVSKLAEGHRWQICTPEEVQAIVDLQRAEAAHSLEVD